MIKTILTVLFLVAISSITVWSVYDVVTHAIENPDNFRTIYWTYCSGSMIGGTAYPCNI